MFVVLTYTIFDLEKNIIEKVDSPISHIQGFGKKLLQKIEDKLNGKQAGDELEVRIEPGDGFGDYDDSLIIKDKLSIPIALPIIVKKSFNGVPLS